MVKTLTYDNPDHKIKPKPRQFQVTGKSTGQINNTSYEWYIDMNGNSTLNALDDCFIELIDERKNDIIPLAQTEAFLNDTVNSSSDHSSSESLVFSSFSSTDSNLVLFLVSSFDFV